MGLGGSGRGNRLTAVLVVPGPWAAGRLVGSSLPGPAAEVSTDGVLAFWHEERLRGVHHRRGLRILALQLEVNYMHAVSTPSGSVPAPGCRLAGFTFASPTAIWQLEFGACTLRGW